MGRFSQPNAPPSPLLDQRLVLFVLGSAAAALTASQRWLGGEVALVLAIGAIAIAVWHGAYDHVQAKPLMAQRLGRAWLPLFVTLYLVLAGAVVLGWWLFPAVSLVLFLAYSAWHFGTGIEFKPTSLASCATGFALGAVPIVAACRWQPLDVARLFALMLGDTHQATERAAVLTDVLAAACWPVVLLAAGGMVAAWIADQAARRAKLLIVLAAELVLFRQCSPLVGFAVYFCLWHTPEHLVGTSARAGEAARATVIRMRANLRAGIAPWAIALLGAGLVALLSRRTLATEAAQVFIVLSALTVPHMVVCELRRMRMRSWRDSYGTKK